MKKFLFLWFLLVVALAACGGGEPSASTSGSEADAEEVVVEDQVDEETGLPFNPEVAPEGEFIVEGPISSLTLTPQDKPEFVIQIPSGKRYRVRSQPLSETFFEDGSPITPPQIRQGMMVRATILFHPDEGPNGEYRTADLTFLLVEE